MICLKRESEELLYNCNVFENGYEDIVLLGRGIFVTVFLIQNFVVWGDQTEQGNTGASPEQTRYCNA